MPDMLQLMASKNTGANPAGFPFSAVCDSVSQISLCVHQADAKPSPESKPSRLPTFWLSTGQYARKAHQ